jgi:endonuclease YncB( thermonuclease family)
VSVYGPFFGIVRDNHDGDTCGVDLDMGFGMAALTRSVYNGKRLLTCRLYGLDAPELRVRVAGVLVENADGAAARDYLAALIPPGTPVKVLSHLWDREGGRFDGELERVADGLNVNADMVASGHAKAWDGTGPKP